MGVLALQTAWPSLGAMVMPRSPQPKANKQQAGQEGQSGQNGPPSLVPSRRDASTSTQKAPMGWVSGGASEAGPSDGLLRDILSNVDGVKPELDSIQRKLTKFVSFSATTSSEIRTLQGGTVGLCEFAVGFARFWDDITLNLHRLKWHGRQLELILKGVSCRATDHPARVVLTTLQNAGLAREVPIRYARIEAARGSAGSTPGPAGSKATVFFVLESARDLGAIFSVKRALRQQSGITLDNWLTPEEKHGRDLLKALPTFQAALAEELAKPPGQRSIRWELDWCILGKGPEAQAWSYERARWWAQEHELRQQPLFESLTREEGELSSDSEWEEVVDPAQQEQPGQGPQQEQQGQGPQEEQQGRDAGKGALGGAAAGRDQGPPLHPSYAAKAATPPPARKAGGTRQPQLAAARWSAATPSRGVAAARAEAMARKGGATTRWGPVPPGGPAAPKPSTAREVPAARQEQQGPKGKGSKEGDPAGGEARGIPRGRLTRPRGRCPGVTLGLQGPSRGAANVGCLGQDGRGLAGYHILG